MESATQPHEFPLILLWAMGADERLFRYQRAAFPKFIVPSWIDPGPKERLSDYAERLARLSVKAVELEASVYMPRIGCGLPGGKWKRIKPIIVTTLCEADVPVTVYENRFLLLLSLATSAQTSLQPKRKYKMRTLWILTLLAACLLPVAHAAEPGTETTAGWVKYPKNPILGGALGTCFDISVLKEGDTYGMWFSWRPKKSIALVESKDGVQWSKPVIVLGPNEKTDWESDINRPVVIKKGNLYQMWYTGQARGCSWIGFATSKDGKTWKRMSDKPVLSAEKPWEKVAVMCPHVLYDPKEKLYRMWYSGGEQYEPNAIGYATSKDGLKWTKHENNPIFRPIPENAWEKERVTACQVVRQGDWYVMFYIGFRDRDHAQIGVARSKDGIGDWQRHLDNPIIRPGKDKWDHDAVYKPYALFDGKRWLLWYNGRRGGVEQIGLALHDGETLGF